MTVYRTQIDDVVGTSGCSPRTVRLVRNSDLAAPRGTRKFRTRPACAATPHPADNRSVRPVLQPGDDRPIGRSRNRLERRRFGVRGASVGPEQEFGRLAGGLAVRHARRGGLVIERDALTVWARLMNADLMWTSAQGVPLSCATRVNSGMPCPVLSRARRGADRGTRSTRAERRERDERRRTRTSGGIEHAAEPRTPAIPVEAAQPPVPVRTQRQCRPRRASHRRQSGHGPGRPCAPAISAELRNHVPMLTRRLAAGSAVAEDPGGGESFGTHRCALLAEGILRAHESGAKSSGDRLVP